MDPFERAEDENAMGYQRWYMERMFLIAPAGAYVGEWLQSFQEFPPRQKPGSFNLDRVMEACHSSSNAEDGALRGPELSKPPDQEGTSHARPVSRSGDARRARRRRVRSIAVSRRWPDARAAGQVAAGPQTDPLPSWNDGAGQAAIIAFVEATTDPARPNSSTRGPHRHLRQ